MRISDWSSDVCSPILDGAAIVVAIFRGLVARMARRARNLILGQIHGIAALVGVIGQHLPGYGIMVAADTEEATEFEHRIVALARALVDHHIDDRAELFILDRKSTRLNSSH